MAINPLQPPINYAGMDPEINIGQQFSELGKVLAERQKRMQAEEVKKNYATDLQAAIDNPTQKTWSDMIAKYPQQREAFTEARKGYGEVAATNEFNQGFEVSMALENSKPEIAKERLTKIIEARKVSGLPTGMFADALGQIEADNVKGAQAGVNLILSMADPDRFKKIVDARTSAVKAPVELRKSLADAEAAETDARVKFETATDDIAKAKALSLFEEAKYENERIKSKFAERGAIADLENKAAQLGLSKAQTGSALAQTKKLGYESQKAALELEVLKASGGLDPVKSFEQEERLRKEYQGRTKVYGELGTTYQNMQSSAAANTGPGDIALITGFMKMLDPGSVVRETEFATARDTAGLFESLKNQAVKLENGQLLGLDSKQRNQYVNLAKKYLDSAQKKAGEDKNQLGIVVKNYKLNPENVFGPAPAAEPVQSNSVIVGGKTYTRPANFTDAQWVEYKQSVGAK